MSAPHRVAVIEALRATLSQELAAIERVAAMARDEASNSETKAEGKYDTRATEASYLARGQAWRVAELRRQVAWFHALDASRPLNPPVVQVGALVQVEGRRQEWMFVAPVGGTSVTVGEHMVRVISPSSPLGKAMGDLEAGDGFEVETPKGLLEYEVLEVR